MGLITSPGWKLRVGVDYPDLVVANTRATWFGGANDSMDSGETASGYPTKGHPELMGCALPMRYSGSRKSILKVLGGSPMPRMPFGIYSNGKLNRAGAWVRVTNFATGKSIVVPVIDLGPARWTDNGIDLTIAAFRALGGSLRQGVMNVSYRVLDGAKYVSREYRAVPPPVTPVQKPVSKPVSKPIVVKPKVRTPGPIDRKPNFFRRIFKALDDFSRNKK